MTDLLDAALAYAERGWPVLPLKPRLKLPATAHGLHDASTDEAVIRAWWRTQPTYNVGLRTGICFDVLDLDSIESLDELDRAGQDSGADGILTGPMALTGRGVHIYVSPTGRGNTAAIRKGIDWRGIGGYVVAPPSVHPNGRIYEWAHGWPIDTPLHEAPDWLLGLWGQDAPLSAQNGPRAVSGPTTPRQWLDQGDRQAYGQKALEGELGRLATAAQGERNDALVRAAFRVGQLGAGGQLDVGDAAGQLLSVALRIGLGQTEAEKTILSGINAGKKEPREPRQRPA